MVVTKIRRPKAIVLDVEGTTTPSSFYGTTLRPFIKRYLQKYLRDNYDSQVVKDLINRIRADNRKQIENRVPVTAIPAEGSDMTDIIKAIDNTVKNELDETKTRAVFSLCVLLWSEGYYSGELKGDVFNDVPAAFRNWKRDGIKVYLVSDALMEIQEMLFTRSKFGNIDQFIEGYFCTEDYGSRQNKECYEKVCRRIKLSPEDVVFVSDSKSETDAASTAGLQTLTISRDDTEGMIFSLKEIKW